MPPETAERGRLRACVLYKKMNNLTHKFEFIPNSHYGS